MYPFPPYPSVAIFGAIAIAAAFLLGYTGVAPLEGTAELTILIAAAVSIALLPQQRSATEDPTTRPLSSVVIFSSLLLFGPNLTMIAAASGPIARWLMAAERGGGVGRLLFNIATILAATQVGGLAHQALGGTLGSFVWPWQAGPIAAAIIGFCLVRGIFAETIWPLITRQPVDRGWPAALVRALPECVVAASLAVAVVELIEHRRWDLLLVAALPAYFAYRAHAASVMRLQDERRRAQVLDALDEGMCVLDNDGRVTFWSDAVARIIGCPREKALECLLVVAVPSLAKGELPQAITKAKTTRIALTLPNVGVSTPAGTRVLQVKILPVVDGVTLLWQDITERRQAEHARKRNDERFALAAEGANDGLWEWDLRTQEFYSSARWRGLLGLPPASGVGRPEDWFARVHADDVAGLKEALDACLSGKTEQLNHEHRIRHEDGSYRQFLSRGIAMKTAGRGAGRLAGSLTDTTARTAAEAGLRGGEFLDPLTGVSNRAIFVTRLGQRLEELKQRRGGAFAVLYLDLDRFKAVNDSLGHHCGDELLVAVSRRLETCLRQGDVLARLGGDEFAILLNGLGEEQQANAIAFRIQDALTAPFPLGGREVFTSASIGIAVGAATYGDPDEMMRDADTAMYHAKSRGKARHELFDADLHTRARDRMGLEVDLRHAVNTNAFEVHYQPIILMTSRRCVGFESLARWTRNGEPVSPAVFIPVAEELGIIEPIGTWVLQQACAAFADWQQRFPDFGLQYITVNVSARQLMQQHFRRVVERAVENSGLKPVDVRLEITETALMDNPDLAAEVLRDLREFGVQIYLDDFGTGCSSLSHLHKLPMDALKIDRSFVRSLLFPDRPAMVESILALARTLKTGVVAEGIEHEAQAQELERLGCTHAQGYLFSRPLTIQAVEVLLAANEPLGPKQDLAGAVAGDGTDGQSGHASTRFDWPAHMSQRSAVVENAKACLVPSIPGRSQTS